MKLIKTLILSLVLVAAMSSCNTTTKEDSSSENTNDTTVQNSDTVANKKYCYRNEYPFQDNSGLKDVEELTYTLMDGQKVVGVYNWLPAEKDQRKGSFEGVLENNIITANYDYQIEGVQSNTQIKIVLEDTQVSVSGGSEELGLKATLKQSTCE